MQNSELIQALNQGKVKVVFAKADGSSREMIATLAESMLPPQPTGEPKGRKPNVGSQVVWDTELQEWRSFRWDRLQSWSVMP
jgi:hypothetical protein